MKQSGLYKIITDQGVFLGYKSNGDFVDVVPYNINLDGKYLKTKIYNKLKLLMELMNGKIENLDELAKLPKNAEIIEYFPIEKIKREKSHFFDSIYS